MQDVPSGMDSRALLQQTVDQIYPLPEEASRSFYAMWQEHRVKRKEILTAAGERERYLYFVLDGVQRIFYQDSDREATLVFSYPPSFSGSLDSFFLQTPSPYYFESLTRSTFLRAPYEAMAACMRQHPAVSEMIRLGVSHALSGILQRMVELQCFSSEEKFRKLLSRSPHILTLVPHKYLANYLGIDPTNFSKLLNSVRI